MNIVFFEIFSYEYSSRGEALLSLDRRQEAIVALEAYIAPAAPDAPDAATTRQVIDALKKDLKAREQQQQQAPKKKK